MSSPLPEPRTSGMASGARRARFQQWVHARFEQAVALSGVVVERKVEIAQRRVRLQFVGTALVEQTMPALEHHGTWEGCADLSILLWDEASSGVGAPPFLWREDGLLVRGDVRHGEQGVHVAYAVDSATLHYVEHAAGLAACWVRDPAQVRVWERAAPLRGLLSGWAQGFRGALVHGAAVGRNGCGVLLTAPSGHGKSTTALSCLLKGWEVLGDDFVLLHEYNGGLRAHSLYSSLKVKPEGLAELSGLRREIESLLDASTPQPDSVLSDDGKRVLWLAKGNVCISPGSLDVKAVIVPSVSATGRAVLRPTTSVRVLAAMLPASVLALPGTSAEVFHRLALWVKRLPLWCLELGRDPSENVALIGRVLDDSRAEARVAVQRGSAS